MQIANLENCKNHQVRASIAASYARFDASMIGVLDGNEYEYARREACACFYQDIAAYNARRARYHMGME